MRNFPTWFDDRVQESLIVVGGVDRLNTYVDLSDLAFRFGAFRVDQFGVLDDRGLVCVDTVADDRSDARWFASFASVWVNAGLFAEFWWRMVPGGWWAFLSAGFGVRC